MRNLIWIIAILALMAACGGNGGGTVASEGGDSEGSDGNNGSSNTSNDGSSGATGDTCALTPQGTLNLGGSPETVVVKDGHALVVNVDGGSGDLVSIDLNDPASPVAGMSIELNGFDFNQSIIDSDTFFILDRWGDITLVDVSDPSAPVQSAKFDAGFPDSNVAVANGHLYVSKNSVTVFNLIDPVEPTELATLDLGFAPKQMVGNTTHLFLVNIAETGDVSLLALDVSDPASPSQVGSLPLPDLVDGIPVIDEDRLYISTHGNLLEDIDSMLHVVDISDPSSPALLGSMSLGGPAAQGGRITASGTHVFMEVNAGAAVVDVSDPTAPLMTGVYDLADTFPDLVASANLLVRDIAISGEHGVIVVYANDDAQENRIEVVDLACP